MQGSTEKRILLLIGTRKGAFTLSSTGLRQRWTLSGPLYLGHIVYHFVPDPRDQRTMLMATKTGHLGPTIFRSNDRGGNWTEIKTPPAFPKVANEADARAVESVFWLTPGHWSEPEVWYAGTSPAGLFRSEDGGDTWESVSGFNAHPNYVDWTKNGATPGGQLLHSILIDPSAHEQMYLSISVGGVFESSDQGKSWTPLNKGCAADFMPDPNVEYGHDPHCVVLHPLKPNRLYQQNHCGIYRLDLPSKDWVRIGLNMPEAVGDIGFPIVLHPRNPDCAWVFPMDGSTVWPRTSPEGKPSTYVTHDAGQSWKRQDKGLPAGNAYFTVKRQAMTADTSESVGLYFGTSQGEVWASFDEGESWGCLAQYLPEIYTLAIAEYA
jgi:photosystem II stability/assembly factor-like uncharacterized protein